MKAVKGGKKKLVTKNGKIDKNQLPSRHVTEGPERAPHRSYYYAMGLTEKEIHQPFVGVVTTWNEAAPCNITLARQAQSVKKGVKAAGGTPREFTTITVTDGIAMGHQGMKSSLISREVIADSTELTVRGHIIMTNTLAPIETWLVVAGIYLFFNSIILIGALHLERRLTLWRR